MDSENSLPSILVVDDESDLLALCEYFFQLNGFRVFCAHNCEAALAILSSEKIDIIFSDICMPGINGIELFEKTKNQNIKFYASTGSFDPANEMLCKKGISNIFYKPYDFEECIVKIKDDLKKIDP